jgi:hypothetical protein
MIGSISLLALINGVLCAMVCLRIVTYSRNGATYKLVMSALAALLAFGTFGEAAYCLLGIKHCVTVSQVIITLGMTVAVFAHKGNVARCLPLPKHKRDALNPKFSRFFWG